MASPYTDMSEERMKALYESFTKGSRPIEELVASNERLKGADAQVLRSKFSAYELHPADCDDFELVSALMTANSATLEARWVAEVEKVGAEQAVTVWERYRDSPNKLPIFDILQVGAFTTLSNDGAIPERYYKVLQWLISLGISVEGTDVAGYTSFQHSLSCTALVRDFRWSTILLEASKDPIAAINHRNRFGATVAHETTMCFVRPGEQELRHEVLTWLLDRGANMDVRDGDGATPRRTAARIPALRKLIEERDAALEAAGGCAFCRRGGVAAGKGKTKEGVAPTVDGIKTMRCGRCHGRNYCSVACQKLDWVSHKPRCSPAPA